MIPQSRTGSFSPNPTAPLHTGISYSPHPSHAGALSAAASPSTSSPTGTSSLTKLVVAQVYLLLGTIKYDKDDPHKWDAQVESLRKLIDDHGMEVFSKYFTRLVVANAAQMFPGVNSSSRTVSGGGNIQFLAQEMEKISKDFTQARKIAESIETGTEDIFRDFDLSSFMEHFKLDALEKTLLALAFKLGQRSDLKTKADAILSTNFPTFVNILSRSNGEHGDLPADFIAELLDRFIQVHPPNFNAAAKKELEHKVLARYQQSPDVKPPPPQVLAALDLIRVLADKPPNALALYIHRIGSQFSADDETCLKYLKNRPGNINPSEEQVAVALTYTTISQTPRHEPSVLVAAVRHVVPGSFRWRDVVSYLDHPGARVTSEQFLRLYQALLPIAQQDPDTFDIQRLWGGEWDNPETQLSFVSAFASLTPEQLDATTIPGLKTTFSLDEYDNSIPPVREFAAYAIKHPLVSEAAMTAVFNVALHSMHASQSTEAKRLFQDVVVPNLAIFVVSAFGVPKPWPLMADDTLVSLFDGFLSNASNADFVLDSLWRRNKDWVIPRLVETHGTKPITLPVIFDHARKHNWLEDLVYLPNGFGLDLAAYAHAEGCLDLPTWARKNVERGVDIAPIILQFLLIKAEYENHFQRPPDGQPQIKTTTTLQVRTVSALLGIVQELLPKTPVPQLIIAQRTCITAYPRLINYGEGFDDIINENGKNGNALPPAANLKMEEHYKKMYGDEIQVRDVVEILHGYKNSRDPVDQDIFACMIHGLFDEYSHYVDYPLEALATTAVLFGGIISHKLITEIPLQVGLGMILEAIRDHAPEQSMYKFGLQALMQLFGRLREWPGFCRQLLQIQSIQQTEAWKKAEEVVTAHDEDLHKRNGIGMPHLDGMANGSMVDSMASESRPPPFASINVDAAPPGVVYEDPAVEMQDKIQFFLNNLTETTLQSMFRELRDFLGEKHQQWFASHLVEERAKMQPNYHHVYLDLVKLFEDKAMWTEVLRETFASVQRMLNSEVTLQNSTERNHLKNLGGWLGLLTLARDKPIKQKNIAFKQLLMEAHDTKRLIVVIPFVCKVLIQGATSNVFRPPNPWLMDIIHLLIELYHNAELKLNLKFEIEVLCKGLSLDHKSIQPSGEILNRVQPVEEAGDLGIQDALNSFETLSVNGIGPGMASGPSPETIPLPPLPDMGPNLTIPQTEVVSASRLHDIVHTALTRALQDIIQPVVDRSVTIAAIATREMVRKDFLTEPDEERMRTSAHNMVKRTAGSLAQVTSKEPLRANLSNYMRTLSSDLPQGLPEGIIMMCINSNIELASSVIEKAAEDRGVPEIDELLRTDYEARRQHRALRPGEPFVDNGLSRWALTIPHPYKLQPNPSGLGAEQMSIYEEFARRAVAVTAASSHVASTSNATNALANEVLADQYSSVPSMPTPAETPPVPLVTSQMQAHYPQNHSTVTNGRQTNMGQVDLRLMAERVNKLLEELERATRNAHEQHFAELPRQHPVLDIIDALTQQVIKTQPSTEFPIFAANQIANLLFNHSENSLTLESLVHVYEHLRRIAGVSGSLHIRSNFLQNYGGEMFLHLPLIAALLHTDLLDWVAIDKALAAALKARKEGFIEFLGELMDLASLSENPVALYTDLVISLEEAWTWILEEPDVAGGQRFKSKIDAPMPDNARAPEYRQHQLDYVFEEWVRLYQNPLASEKMHKIFLRQLRSRDVITSTDDVWIFLRQAFDRSVEQYEHNIQARGPVAAGYLAIDALAKMVFICFSTCDTLDGRPSKSAFLTTAFAATVLVMNHHQDTRGENFGQRVFFRFFSTLLHQIHAVSDEMSEAEHSQVLLGFAASLRLMLPSVLPGFVFQWISLIGHRLFLPEILGLADDAGWPLYAQLVGDMLSYLGDLLRPVEISPLAKGIYQGVLKLLAVLQHDYPDFVAAHHLRFIECLPPHASQLQNMILVATPANFSKLPDPLQPGLKVDRISDIRETFGSAGTPADLLSNIGLLEVLEQCLQNGPSEDAVAQISHAFNDRSGSNTAFGLVHVGVNRPVINAVVDYIGGYAISKSKGDASVFVPDSSDVRTLQMLISELAPEPRYYLISAIVNELRFANATTHYFSQVLLEIFGHDMSDPEEMEIRQQIVRVLLERLVGYWPQPWGLMITTIELIKNDKFMFFELPFIKSDQEVAKQFATFLSAAR